MSHDEVIHTIDNSVVLEAVELTKLYDDGVLALEDVSFQVRKGEIYVMLGANGAGKTTTINCFLNFYPTDTWRSTDQFDSELHGTAQSESTCFVNIRKCNALSLFYCDSKS